MNALSKFDPVMGKWFHFLVGLVLLADYSRCDGEEITFEVDGVPIVLQEVGPEADVIYTSMRFSPAHSLWIADATLTNQSFCQILGPAVLLIDDYSGTTGPLNPDGWLDTTPPKPYYVFDESLPQGVLAPGSVSEPQLVSVGYTNIGSPRLVTRVFALADTTPPLLACPEDLTILCGEPTDPLFTGEATATDACGAVKLSYADVLTGACPDAHTITRTWTAKDTRGNSTNCQQIITVIPNVVENISVLPAAYRFVALETNLSLTVLAHYRSGSTSNVTDAAETEFSSGNPFVSRVDAAGVVRPLGNGSTIITVSHQGFSAEARITVEIGVTLNALQVSPGNRVLRSASESLQLEVTGTFSDGSTRDLSGAADGTTYQSSNEGAATVSADGLVSVVSDGVATITVYNESLTAQARIQVDISTGIGFLRGEVYDDRLGLPLTGGTATLLEDGSGPLTPPESVAINANGQYVFSGSDGPALVRIGQPGYTSVDRRAEIPAGTSARPLDARLTPLDSALSMISSAGGGTARDSAGLLRLEFAAGAVSSEIGIRLTSVSNQGLQGRLPAGWSPVTGVDIQPAGLAFGQSVVLTVPNPVKLSAGSSVAAAFYDEVQHEWVGLDAAMVSADGKLVSLTLTAAHQVVLLIPDTSPLTPPPVIPGSPVVGVDLRAYPPLIVVTGKVVPRSAPPGDDARAVGSVVIETADPLPSGSPVEVRIREQFDLLDASTIVPVPFIQDILLYERPRATDGRSISTVFPITPSRNFTIQELELGVVRLSIAPPVEDVGGSVVGSGGGSLTDARGNRIDISPGALLQDAIVGLLPLASSQLTQPVPTGQQLIGAVQLELPAGDLLHPATLSIPRPASMAAGDQVLVAGIFTGPDGVRRLRILAIGVVQADRIVSQTVLGSLTFPGITSPGQILFLKGPAPLGFVTGTVYQSSGAAPQESALVTADTAPFADLTSASGTYVVAGESGRQSKISAIVPVTGNGAFGDANITTRDEVVPLDLTIQVLAPLVVSTSPANLDKDVPLSTPVTIKFSEVIAPVSVSSSSVFLETGGVLVNAALSLSADGLVVALTPGQPLTSATTYRLTLTAGIKDLTGNPLQPFTPVSFTTVDTSKPPQPAAGLITALLPDEGGLVLVTGTQGASEPGTGVSLANLRTSQSVTAISETDGSFRLRITALVGDPLTLTFRNASGQVVTTLIPQLEDPDGKVGLGTLGGFAKGLQGRVASILPHALQGATLLKIGPDPDSSALPVLTGGFAYADRFAVELAGGPFTRLTSLTLSESADRLDAPRVTTEPYQSEASLVVPANFLINGRLRFSATVTTDDGRTASLEESTLVVGSSADSSMTEVSSVAEFPTLFLAAPREALPAQQITVEAVSPKARINFELPDPVGLTRGAPLMLARIVDMGGEKKLSILDTLEVVELGGSNVLRTTGRVLPGAHQGGRYVVISSTDPLVQVTGRITGPAATVSLDGTPFIFEANSPNAHFLLPVPAGRTFSLNFLDPATLASVGTVSNTAPTSGEMDLGKPLGDLDHQLFVTVQPDADFLADINTDLEFDFSEPIDELTVTPDTILITDAAGIRVEGAFKAGASGRKITFTPSRRWRFGATYRFWVSTEVLALSGTRLTSTYNGEFTTFQPRVIATRKIDDARDVSVAGDVALVGGSTGLAVLDVSAPEALQVVARLSRTNGISGVLIHPNVHFVDRTARPVDGTLGLAVSGDNFSKGMFEVLDLNVPALPKLIGSAQMTVPAGDAAPVGVPNSPGTPNQIAMGLNGRAVVAVQSVGVQSVSLPGSIPISTNFPGTALGAAYPEGGLLSFNDVAAVGSRIAAVGQDGLSILDGNNMKLLFRVTTAGEAKGVDALAVFQMDINGNGVVDPVAEVFDLVVVANGSDGTLQLYALRNAAAPALIGAVRLNHPANSVVLDPVERLAYVCGGAGGLSIIDLSGPSVVQPLDQDRNGIDDRILGRLASAGSANHLALELHRGIGLLADGPAGVTTLQLTPPRARITDVVRDPLLTAHGDEESIVDSRTAFLTDDALHVSVEAVIPPQQSLVLVIDDTTGGAGGRLTFANGQNTVPLNSGVSAVDILIGENAAAVSSTVSLRIQDATGVVVDRFDLRLVDPGVGGLTIKSIGITPRDLQLGVGQSAQVSVRGVATDGRTYNLTEAAAGTTYRMANANVASISANGLVTGLAGGASSLTVSSRGLIASGSIHVEGPASLVDLAATQAHFTLTATGATKQLTVLGILSDGSVKNVTQGFGLDYTSRDPNAVAVNGSGLLTAIGEGVTTVSFGNGTISKEVQVAVEFRQTADLASIDLLPFSDSVSADTGKVTVRAQLTGTGSLEGLAITFAVTGASSFSQSAVSEYGGVVLTSLQGLTTPGAFTVTASVTDPASGSTLSDSETLVVEQGSGDNEPNDNRASASRLVVGKTVTGTVGGTDFKDCYVIESPTAGTHTFFVKLNSGVNPSNVAFVVYDKTGTETARYGLTGLRNSFVVTNDAGSTAIALESSGPVAGYSISASFSQGAVTIASVVPSSGGPGTAVTITGGGFSLRPSENIVLFGGIAASVVSASAGQLQVTVPANGIDGSIEVLVRSKSAKGPVFVTGNAGPPPPITLAPMNPANVRFDPVAGVEIDVTRMRVYFNPSATRSQVEGLITPLGGSVVGHFPTFNTYVVEFAGNRTVAGLATLRRQVKLDPLVQFTARSTILRGESAAKVIDTRDYAAPFLWGVNPVSSAAAYDTIHLFEAIRAIRESTQFQDASEFKQVSVAIIDSGFNPLVLAEDPLAPDYAGLNFQFFTGDGSNAYVPTTTKTDPLDHGSQVASVIFAANDGTGTFLSGELSSLFQPGEANNSSLFVFQAANSEGIYPEDAIIAALHYIGNLGTVDVVNISAGQQYAVEGEAFSDSMSSYSTVLQSLEAKTLVVTSAGNDGVDAALHTPSFLATMLGNVICVAATAVANGDGTGEVTDQRAVFGNLEPIGTQKSNFGDSVTLAAPGEDVLVTPATEEYALGQGTSMAAPMVAGVAAILKAIRPDLNPADIKDTLFRTADDISLLWDAGSMRRLNALAAVLTVLDPLERKSVYVADRDFDVDPAADPPPGQIVVFDVNPTNGVPLDTPARTIALSYSLGTTDFVAQKPTAMAMSPFGDELYVVVKSYSPSPDVGDGLLVINTHTDKAVDFISFSGEPVPPEGSVDRVELQTLKPGMVFSPDGQLLYVATSQHDRPIAIINTVERKLVQALSELPYPYSFYAQDPAHASPDLAERFETLQQHIDAGIDVKEGGTTLVNRPGTIITGLDISPDGKTLFAAVQTGIGGGLQAGAVLPINVDLYSDANPDVPGLQPNLENYFFAVESGSTDPVLRLMTDAKEGSATGGDEPVAVAADPQGKHVYLVNGGVERFTTFTPISTGFSSSFFSEFAPLMAAKFLQSATFDFEALSGYTLIKALGMVGVFDTGNVKPEWRFNSDVVYGWNPPPSLGGIIVNQLNLEEVYISRPYDMAIRPDGKRAILPYFQTGNYGVLDLEQQALFSKYPPVTSPNSVFASADTSLFQAVVGVTPSLSLNAHAWPDRGVFTADSVDPALGRVTIPSPDESLLYAWDAVYAQNGAFAVVAHAGTGSAGYTKEVYMPDFENDTEVRKALEDLGFSYSSGSTITAPDGITTYSVGQAVEFVRGGGAVSIVWDEKISADFQGNASSTVVYRATGDLRPYYSQIPICDEVLLSADGAPRAICSACVSTNIFTYSTNDTHETRFHRPRAVAIDPFFVLASPRFGEEASPSQALQLLWGEDGVATVRVVFEGGTSGSVDLLLADLPAEQLGNKTLKLTVKEALEAAGITLPEDLTDYRVTMIGLDSDDNEISRASTRFSTVRENAIIDGPEVVRIRTTLDPINKLLCHETVQFTYTLSVEADVVSLQFGTYSTSSSAVTPGTHTFEFTSLDAGTPGELPYTLTASISGRPDVVDTGIIYHEVEINASLPVGHTIVKGVDIWDGHLVHSSQDVKIPGRGLSLEFTRTYSSAGESSAGPLGAGWTHNYNVRLFADSCGRYVVVGGEGSGNAFTDPHPDPAKATLFGFPSSTTPHFFTPQIGYHSTLLRDNTGEDDFDFYTKSHVRYHFVRDNNVPNEVYLLDYIEEPNGNRIDLIYDNPPANGFTQPPFGDGDPSTLDQVKDSSGRSLLFENEIKYEQTLSESRIVRITGTNEFTSSDLGLLIEYAYDGYGNLTNVTRRTLTAAIADAQDRPVDSDLFGADGAGYNYNDERVETYSYTPGLVSGAHNLTNYIDPNGNSTSYEYYTIDDFNITETGIYGDYNYGNEALSFGLNGYEIVKSITELEGVQTKFDYDFAAGTRTVSDPRPNVASTTYTVNDYGATTQIVEPLGSTTRTTSMEWCTDTTSPNCLDVNGLPVLDVLMVAKTIGKDTEQERETEYFYEDGLGNLTKEVIHLPSAMEPVFDRDGIQVSEVVTTYTYDPVYGKMTSRKDAEGHTTSYTIDPANGNLLAVEDAAHNITGYTYAGSTSGTYVRGDLKTITARNFVTTYETYDAYGNPTRITREVGGSAPIWTENSYDERSRLAETSDIFGHHVKYAYDGLDRTISQSRRDDLNNHHQETLSVYLPNGELKKVKNGLGHITEHFYDGLNRRTGTTEYEIPDPLTGRDYLSRTTTYDEANNVVQESDYRGVVQEHTYDDLNRLTKTVILSVAFGGPNNADNSIAAYTYDIVNNRRTETDLHGYTTTSFYDGLYRVVAKQLPFSHSYSDVPHANQALIRTKYDRVGNVIEITDANGNATTNRYDEIYRLVCSTNADGIATTNTYDRSSNKVRVESLSSGLVTEWFNPSSSDPDQAYDGLNRPLAVRTTVPAASGFAPQTYTQTLAYTDSDNSVRATNRRGFKTLTVKDGLDRIITTIVDEGGLNLTTTYTYDGNGNVVTITDPEPGPGSAADVTNGYDGLNRKTSVTYIATPSDTRADARIDSPTSITERFVYDGNNNLVEYTDKRGVVFANTHDNLNRPLVKSVREDLSNGGAPLSLNSLTYQDTPVGGLYTVVSEDANGNVVQTRYDSLGRVTEIDDPDPAGLISYKYDGVNKRSETDKKNQRTQFDYDVINRLIETREYDAAGDPQTTLNVAYFDENNRVEHVDRRGITTINQNDALGRLLQLSKQHPDMGTNYLSALTNNNTVVLETYAYDGNNNVIRFQDGQSNVTTNGYDGADRKTIQTVGVGSAVQASTSYTYDKVGNVRTIKDGRNHGGTFDVANGYDKRYRLVTSTNGELEVTSYAYDGNNNRVSVTEPKGSSFTTTYVYDELNTLLAVDETSRGDIYTAAGATRFVYDANRNKIAQQDAKGVLVTYKYDALNRLTNTLQHKVLGTLNASSTRGADPRGTDLYTNPSAGNEATALKWFYGYDLNGNQDEITDARGQKVFSTYDYLDRLVTKTYTNHANPSLDFQMLSCTYAYDGNGNPTSITELKTLGSGTVTETTLSTYDPLNRVQTKRHFDYDDTVGKLIGYDYDIQGNRTSVVDADGTNTLYFYDERNRLATVTTEAGDTAYEWWEDSLLKKVTYPTSPVATICDRSGANAYDRADRVLLTVNRSGTGTFSSYAYTYDDNGNRTNQVETQRDLPLSSPGTPETTSYAYDNLNRLLRVSYGSRAVTNTYESNGNRLTEKGTDPVTGKTLNRAYAYDSLNALRTITDNAFPSDSVAYDYDDNLNQIEKVKGSVTRRYDFGIRDHILRAEENGSEVARYDYNSSRMRTKKLEATGAETRYLYDDRAVLQEYNGATVALPTIHKYNYGYDLLSLTEASPAGSANRLDQFYLKDALMTTVNLTDESGGLQKSYRYDAWGRVRDDAGTSTNPRQYTGHYKDDETGLHYFGARYYDEEIGRFLSQDPYLGEANTPPSLHRFLYAYANPLRFIDLTGYANDELQENYEDVQRVTEQRNTPNMIRDMEQMIADNPDMEAHLRPLLDQMYSVQGAEEDYLKYKIQEVPKSIQESRKERAGYIAMESAVDTVADMGKSAVNHAVETAEEMERAHREAGGGVAGYWASGKTMVEKGVVDPAIEKAEAMEFAYRGAGGGWEGYKASFQQMDPVHSIVKQSTEGNYAWQRGEYEAAAQHGVIATVQAASLASSIYGAHVALKPSFRVAGAGTLVSSGEGGPFALRRQVAVVESPGAIPFTRKKQAFYRRNEVRPSPRPPEHAGAKPGEWAPFERYNQSRVSPELSQRLRSAGSPLAGHGSWFQKRKYFEGIGEMDPRYSYGTLENRRIAEWLGRQEIPRAPIVTSGGTMNRILESYGYGLPEVDAAWAEMEEALLRLDSR